jgi:hypothetical protein
VLGVAASAALLGGALLLTSAAHAAAAPAGRCAPQSLNKDVKHADVVFRGIVDRAMGARGPADDRTRTYAVTADRVYKASLVADQVRVTTMLSSACPPPKLKKGKRYIFFVTEEGSRLVSTQATARATHELTSHVEAKLGGGKPPRSAPPVNAEFTKVADAAPPALSRLLAPGVALLILSLLGLLVVARMGRRTT